MSDFAALVKAAQHGDGEAFSQLYSLVYRDLYKTAYYMLMHKEDAEDAVSQAIVKAYSNIGSLRDPEKFKAWIFSILSNQCRHKIKQIIKEKGTLPLDDAILPQEASPDNQVDDWMYTYKLLENLDYEERLIVVLSIVGGYSKTEIARILKKPQGTIRSKYSRALDKLRKEG
jgi:RNA polymerase sigma factor (sigma-70 family)